MWSSRSSWLAIGSTRRRLELLLLVHRSSWSHCTNGHLNLVGGQGSGTRSKSTCPHPYPQQILPVLGSGGGGGQGQILNNNHNSSVCGRRYITRRKKRQEDPNTTSSTSPLIPEEKEITDFSEHKGQGQSYHEPKEEHYEAYTGEFGSTEPEDQDPSDDYGFEGEVGDEVGAELTPEEIQSLTDGDPELERKIKMIQMELVLCRGEGVRAPSHIPLRRWKELLALISRHQRRKFFNFLFIIEMKQQAYKKKKQERTEERLREYATSDWPTPEEDERGLYYGLNRNTLFLRLYESKVTTFYHHRVVSAMIHGPQLVIDCGYDDDMNPREAKNCSRQLELTIVANRTHPQPFDLHFCNASPNSKVMTWLKTRFPPIYEPSYPLNIYEKSYLETFDRKRLVYLSPHARDVLDEYCEDDVYIIGAIVDKSSQKPLSTTKAKREGIRVKKLPLDQYLDWGTGSGKSLTLNQMMAILLEIRQSGDWESALKCVPRRKLKPYQIAQFGGKDDGDEEGHVFQRRENQSEVLKDYALMNSRKGFKGKNFHNRDYNNRGQGQGRPWSGEGDMENVPRPDYNHYPNPNIHITPTPKQIGEFTRQNVRVKSIMSDSDS